MSDVNANIGVHIDTSSALAELKNLQRQLATFHSSIAKTSAAATAAQKGLQTNLLNSINSTGKFTATMGNVRSSTESFTHALESNKLSMREYFRYAGGASKTFGKLFRQEFDTIGKVAEDRVKKMQTQYIKMGRDANGAIKAMAITPTTLNMNDYATKTAMAAQKQALFNQVVKQGSTSLLNFGKNTQWAGRQLMVGFTVPLAYFGTVAAKTFMDLEAQAIKFKRVYGDMFTTTEQTNKALADVELLAKEFTKYGVAVSKTMEMAASAAAMGKTGADLTAQVAQATRLAVLGNVEQEQALETTTSLTNAFGIAAEDLAQKINFLNSVENQTVTSIEDLTIAIPKAGPVVKQLGGDVEDLAFFLTAMKEGGINASEGANALKSGLASIINPSKKASAMLMDLGVNIKGIVEGNQGDIKSTVIGFAQALDTLAPLDRSRAIEQLFGKFQFARLSTLFQNITKEGTQANKVLELSRMEVEELAILSERELKTVEDAVGTNFKSAIEELKLAIAPIGKTFLQAVTPIVKVIGDVLEKFNGLGEGTKKFIVIATTLVGIIGPTLLMTFGLVANGAANIIKLFLALRGGFLKVGGNSKILAEQTSYLNAEQLESATVAASLNQAHTRLTQSFTVEASAVKALRAAYVEATIAGANFARANPGMMMPGRSGKAPKKFADGTTGLPGPKGAGDIIPILGAPGEAIIPAKVAQDDRFKPIIDAMVNGNLQGYEEGTVKLGSKSFKTKSQQTARDLEKTITELRSQGIPEEKIVRALERNIERGRPMNATQLKRRLSIGRGSSSGSSAPSSIRSLAKQSQSGFRLEIEAVKESLKKQGVALTPAQEKNLFNVQASHIEESKTGGVKEWKANNLVADLGYVNNYINTVKGKLGTDLLKMSDAELQKLGINRKELQRLQAGTHPTTADAAKTLRAVAQYDSIRNPGSYQAKAVVAGLDSRAKTDFYAKPLKTLAETQPISSRAERAITSRVDLLEQERNAKVGNDSQQVMKQIDKDIRKTALGKQSPTNFGTQVSPTTGHSFPVKGLGGIYQKPDGTRVFVKPVMDAKAALAEQRATTIARDVHGLDSPKQEIRTMIDPTDPTGKRKLIVLESAFDPKFDPNKMTNKFTKGEYFKQLVAANLRGDKDLGRGNLSGNVLADVGTAGVFEKASGKRDFAKTMPSMAEQAKINLLGVKGGAKRFFAESTLGVPQGMTADQYHNNMIKEIDKVLPKLKATIAKFDLNPAEKEAYSGMITRLEEGKKVNWREFHKIHSSVLATKKEALQDKKTGEITSIKGKPKPRGVVASTGKASDRVMTQVPAGKRIVQKPRGFISSRFGKTMLPGYADAPRIDITDGMLESQKPGSVSKISESVQLKQSQIRAMVEKTSINEAKRRNKAEARLAKSLEAGVDVIDENTKATGETVKAQKATKEKLTKFSNKAGLGIGAMSGLTIAASFAGGQIGEMAQKIMPFVFGLQGIVALLPLLANPFVAIPLAIAAVVAGLYFFKKKQDDATKAEARLVDAIYATTSRMQKVGELSGKVGASELMGRKRESNTGDFSFDRKGIKFGSAFLKSEVGKEDIATFETRFKAMPDIAMKEFALKLGTYVSDGVIDAAQAASIADQVGIEFKDKVLGLKIQGQLQELISVDGRDLTKEPFLIRVKIAEETISQFDNLLPNLQGQLDQAEKEKNRLKEKMLIALQDEAVGAITAEEFEGIEKEFRDAEKRLDYIKKSVSENSAFAAGLASQAYESIQAQIDGIEVTTAKSLEKLKTEKAATKDLEKQALIQKQIDSLELKRTDSLKKLRGMNDRVTRGIERQLELADEAEKRQFFLGSGEAVRSRFKGTKQESDAELLLAKTAQMQDSVVRAKIEAVVSSGQFGPAQATGFINLFADDQAGLDRTLNAYLNFQGIDDLNKLQSILGSFGDQELAKKIMIDMSGLTDKEFQAQYSTLELLMQMDNEEINIELALKDPGALAKITKINTAIENIPDVTQKSVELVLAANGFPAGGIAEISENWKYFADLPDKLRKTALQTYTTLHSTIFANKESRIEWASQQAKLAASQAPHQVRQQVEQVTLAKLINVETGEFTTEGNKATARKALEEAKDIIGMQEAIDKILNPGGGGEEKKEAKASIFATILQDLKRTRDAFINAQGGAAELMRILGGAEDIQVFKGMDQQLANLGANSDFIDFVGGLEKAVEEKVLKINEKGVVSYGIYGEAAKKAYDEKQLGLFSAKSAIAIKELQGQRTSFIKLKAAGVESADAVEMLGDATFALSLAAQQNPTEVKAMIDQWKIMKKELNLTTAAINPQQYFDDQMAIAERQFSYQEAMARRTYEPQIQATEELIKANNLLIDQAQRKLEIDATYGSRQIDKINSEIDGLNRQLAAGIDNSLEQLSLESGKLSEDQTAISKTVDAINEKYDLQEKALSKISDLNQEIIAEKKTQISLADALTQGDISAAAQAAQDLRAASADRAQKLAEDTMTAARESEISRVTGSLTGKTATQISERQYEIDRLTYTLGIQRNGIEAQIEAKKEEIYKIDLLRKPIIKDIADAEDRIYTLTAATALGQSNSLGDLQKRFDAELDIIKKQRERWTDAKFAIEGANIRTKEFQDKLIAAEGLIKSVGGLWKDITDKNLKVTIETIEKVIRDQGSFTKAGTVQTKQGPVDVDASGKAADGSTPIAVSKESDKPESPVYSEAQLSGMRYQAQAPKPSNFTYGQNNAPTYVSSEEQQAADDKKAQKEAQRAAAQTTQDIIDAARKASVNPATMYEFNNANIAFTGPAGLTSKDQESPEVDAAIARSIDAGRVRGSRGTIGSFLGGLGLASGGMVPKYFAAGGLSRGTDIIPAMLTPGEFVINKNAANSIGTNNLNKLNSGQSMGNSVYNYSVGINVTNADANANDIARAVMGQIKYIDSQRIRGQR
jgi:TP901 family phage tail tape measure protein